MTCCKSGVVKSCPCCGSAVCAGCLAEGYCEPCDSGECRRCQADLAAREEAERARLVGFYAILGEWQRSAWEAVKKSA